MKTLFSPADVALPRGTGGMPADISKWAVIACDQFTSDPGYWAEAERLRAGVPSALDLILPEAYLGTQPETAQRARVSAAMKSAAFDVSPETMIYLRRTLPDGRVRRGLIGKFDLEAYDYRPGSASAIRATEETVLSRIPPRVAIRAEAVWELPHIMILMDDADGIIRSLDAEAGSLPVAYRAQLMLGGGAAEGFFVRGDALTRLTAGIAGYESAKAAAGDFAYAMGDGNHSLAAAKAHYEALKQSLGASALTHPARYALAEVVALDDEALDFEPIYRVLLGCDPADVIAALRVRTALDGQKITALTRAGNEELALAPVHALTVGTLQAFLDGYVAAHPGVVCDYIHDESALRALSAREDAVGFLFEGMAKSELFPYVRDHGTLPRKTFSMGEARSKRYYLEARKITL